MRPLMTPAMHERFADLHDDLVGVDGNASQVFVPVAPVGNAPIRLLVVGQATRGWSEEELADYGTAWRRAAGIVASPPPGSGFWQVVGKVVSGIHAHAGIPVPAGGLAEAIGWSNLLKVGHPDRNPHPGSWGRQAGLCIEQLRHEVETMQPSAVVLMTRDFASRKILLPVFGEEGWTNDVPEMDRVAWKLAPMPIVWMNHPRNMGPKGYREASVRTAIEVIGGHLSMRGRMSDGPRE